MIKPILFFFLQVGLCTNLNAASLGTVDPDSFFPRCYKICSEEDKNAFVGRYYDKRESTKTYTQPESKVAIIYKLGLI